MLSCETHWSRRVSSLTRSTCGLRRRSGRLRIANSVSELCASHQSPGNRPLRGSPGNCDNFAPGDVAARLRVEGGPPVRRFARRGQARSKKAFECGLAHIRARSRGLRFAQSPMNSDGPSTFRQATKERIMNRTFAHCTIALMCIAPVLIVGAALLLEAVAGPSPSRAGPIQPVNPIHQETTVGRAG